MANLLDEGSYISTVVAIDRDKNSQHAVKWAVENLKLKDDRIILVHVTTQLNRRYPCSVFENFVIKSINEIKLF